MKNSRLKKGIALGVIMFLFGLTVQAQPSDKKQGAENKIDIEAVFVKRDKNNDGKLEKSELIGLVSNDFSKLDKDEDGYLSKEELSKASKFNRGKGNRRGRPNTSELLVRMDADKDGKLSKDEVKGPLANDFSKIDSNNDGFISKKELDKAPKPRRNEKPRGKKY